MVGERKECNGSEIYIGKFRVPDECAFQCKGKASMFAFGTNDYGKNRCHKDACNCLCETSSTHDGTCTIRDHDGYRLYKYLNANPGEYFVFYH